MVISSWYNYVKAVQQTDSMPQVREKNLLENDREEEKNKDTNVARAWKSNCYWWADSEDLTGRSEKSKMIKKDKDKKKWRKEEEITDYLIVFNHVTIDMNMSLQQWKRMNESKVMSFLFLLFRRSSSRHSDRTNHERMIFILIFVFDQ